MSVTLLESAQTQILALIAKGVARSTRKLAALSGQGWDMHVISLDVGSGERFRAILARDAREHLGVWFSAPGERYLVLFSHESGEALLKASPLDSSGRRPMSPAWERATLTEAANILINGLSGELAEGQGMVRIISGPKSMTGRKADIYGRAFGDLAPLGGDSMVNVLIHIASPELAADCTLMLRMDALNANFLVNTDPDLE